MIRIDFFIRLVMVFFSVSVFAGETKPLLNIENWQTENGMRVYFVAAPTLPILDMELLFDAGSSREGSQYGLASLTNTLLSAGGVNDTNDSIAEAFSAIGAEIGFEVRKDLAAIQLRTLSAATEQEKALALLAKILTPAFRGSDLAREKVKQIKAIELKQDYPDKVAQDLFFASLYGDHPYGHPSIGSLDTVKAITEKDLRQFFDTFYVAKNASLVMVGALDTQAAKKIAETLSKRLNSGVKPAALPTPTDKQDTFMQKAMNSQQSQIMYGTLGASRLDATWPALFVGNEVLGGGTFDSRLFVEIREKHGLAYGANSYFIPMQSTGPWLASLQTRTEKQSEALSRLKNKVNEFIQQGPTEAEVIAAKQNIISGFPLSFRSNGSILDSVSIIAFYNLPISYYDDFLKAVSSTTVKDIHSAFQNQFSNHGFLTVIVGQEKIQDVKNKTKNTSK